jgi:DNA-binding response OmpR family regulator
MNDRLEKENFVVDSAHDGQKAVDKVKEKFK